jgi:hypothetical protein
VVCWLNQIYLETCVNPSVPSARQLHTPATATPVPAAVLWLDPVIFRRKGHVWGSRLARGPLGASGPTGLAAHHH